MTVTETDHDHGDAKAASNETSQTHRHPSNKKPSTPTPGLSLAWDQTIKPQAIGISSSSQANGRTLEQIVASQAAGRDDGQLCSACHNRDDAQGGYGLTVEKNGSLKSLDPWQKVGTKEQRPWAGKSGWVSRFINNQTKPAALKAVMQAWLNGGCKEDQEL